MVAIVPAPPARVAPPPEPTHSRVPTTPPPREAWTPVKKVDYNLASRGSKRILADVLSKDDYTSMVAARLTGGVAASVVLLTRRHPAEPWGLTIRMDGHGTWLVWEMLMGGVAHQSHEIRAGDRIVDINGQTICSRAVLEEMHRYSLTLELGVVRRGQERLMTASSRGWKQCTSAPSSRDSSLDPSLWPAPSTGARPAPSTGARPAPSTGARPAPSTGARPAPSTGTRRASRGREPRNSRDLQGFEIEEERTFHPSPRPAPSTGTRRTSRGSEARSPRGLQGFGASMPTHTSTSIAIRDTDGRSGTDPSTVRMR